MIRAAATALVLLGLAVVPAAAQSPAVTAEATTVKVPPTGARVCLGLQQDGRPAPQACTDAGPLALIPKQDGMFHTGRPDYEAVAGQPLTSCVRDRVSGLVWEGKPDSGKLAWMRTQAGPPGTGRLITTYGPHNEPAPGSRANTDAYSYHGDGRPGDAMAYVAQVNAMRLCGFTDWRLPTVAELHGLLDLGELIDARSAKWPAERAAVDERWLPNTVPGNYMTSEPDDETRIWCVNFIVGFVYSCNRRMERKPQPLFVRLVRGPEVPETGRWREVPDERGVPGGVVEDRHTGLAWRRCEEPQVWNGQRCTGTAQRYGYMQALQRASEQPGWRLPTIKEVNSLAERWFKKLDIPAADFPVSGTQPLREGYWSSTVCSGGAATREATAWIRAWMLGSGGDISCEVRNLRLGVRLVRE
ncbi:MULTISPECIES: DUF1566 domain-containing protein [unclassified Variovorax]|jgi:hypothetical protein|nr:MULTISPECIES: DUF1566 domain-containing protein [unclassified Variovorax]RSZ47564.1 DUF1566 domain-containing protein [Variovorax sp. 553]RSZ48312.1 DUF1566 domain-containing protein [Variovorax sp. 679]